MRPRHVLRSDIRLLRQSDRRSFGAISDRLARRSMTPRTSRSFLLQVYDGLTFG
jgi:hypothetical protein